MQRASYRAAVAWIGENDEPSERDPQNVAYTVTALLIADIFGVTPERVGADVARYRVKNDV